MTICDLAKSRLRALANHLRDRESQPNAAMNSLDDDRRVVSPRGEDRGFRVFKLDTSNIRTWEPGSENLAQTLEQAVEHLRTDRTEGDFLYELLLKLGLDLASPIETRVFVDKQVHAVGGGVLLACLATKINSGEVEDLALMIVAWLKELSPAGESTLVFKDSAFADDVAKTNLAAILQQHGLKNVRRHLGGTREAALRARSGLSAQGYRGRV